MQIYQKSTQERRGVMNQPNIIMFASPSITPSNNYKTGGNTSKDLTTSQIQGRKVDSPQLRIMKDLSDSKSNFAITYVIGQHRREDFASMFNFQPVSELNHTNKEIQKKQFDFGVKQNKGNVTIQYDSYDPPRGISHQRQISKGNKQSNQGQSKKEKNIIESYGRRRQQSQSAAKQNNQSQINQQQVAQIIHNQLQPLINLNIPAKQTKNAIFNYQKSKPQENQNYNTGVKYQSNLKQSGNNNSALAQKHRSKSKNRQKSVGNKSQLAGQFRDNMIKDARHKQKQLNYSNMNQDNKENLSLNHAEVSPKKQINQKIKHQFLDSDSSISSPITDNKIAQKLEKSYFVEKSQLLKHLSPERQRSQSKGATNQHHQNNADNSNSLSERDKSKMQSAENTTLLYKSNNSTIIQQPLQVLNPNILNESSKNIKFKIKRPLTGYAINNKLYIKGVDKIIRENLKKNRTKEEEEISKRYLEDFKQKLKKIELSQRNQQVRKINASKIIYNHQHKNSQVNHKIALQKVQYKKQRSKSCMNKTDSIFGGFQKPRSKERLKNNYDIQQNIPQQLAPSVQPIAVPNETKKEKKREKSLVLELKELTKQIDIEIRREIMKGKLEVQPISAANKRTNLSTINAKKDTSQTRKKNHDSKEEIAQGDQSNAHSKSRRKSKSKDNINKSISQNIKKYTEKKRHHELKLKSLEQTIENQRQEKRIENLLQLQEFVRNHNRHKSYYVNSKPAQTLINYKQNKPEIAQQIKGIQKTLKAKFSKEKHQPKNKSDADSMILNEKDISRIQHQSQYKNQNDISQDLVEEYQKIMNSLAQDNKRQSSTPQKKPQNNKVQVFRREAKPKDVQGKKGQKVMISPLKDSVSGDEQQMTAIKHDIIHELPNVKPERGATIIPPQSDIATLEKSFLDISKIEKSSEQKRQERKSQDSEKKHQSPQKDKMRALISMYGYNIPRSQLNKPSGETKLLIKLHSAAITIQQNVRKQLFARGFYEKDDSSEQSGSMYVNSDEDQDQYNDHNRSSDKKYQKEVPKRLVATTSPLRVKERINHQQEVERKLNNFYSADSSDMEKVVVCSVITSGRPDGDDSLSNTQKYVPLRQKPNLPSNPLKIQSSSVASSVNSGFNTAIKAQPVSIQQRPQDQSKDQSQLDISTTSQRRGPQIPSLNFDKLPVGAPTNQQIQNKVSIYQEEIKHQEPLESSTRSIFNKTGFQDLLSKIPKGEGMNLSTYPEMIQIREQAIQLKKSKEEEMLKKMIKTKQISPRTYDTKMQDIEKWVHSEQNEVQRSQQIFEEMYQKTVQILEETKNSDLLKSLREQQKEQKINDIGKHAYKPYYDDNQSINPNEIIMSNRKESSRSQHNKGIIEQIYSQDVIQVNQIPKNIPVPEKPQPKIEHKIDMFEILRREREEEQAKEKLKREQELAEQKRQDEIKRKAKIEQELKAQQELRELRRKQEEEAKLREKEIERKAIEERRKREEERLRIEQEQKRRDQERREREEREKQEKEIARQKAEQEALRIQKEKEEQEAQFKREQEAKLAELNLQRELRIKQEKEKQLEKERKQKSLEEEYKRKMELMDKKFASKQAQVVSPPPFIINDEPIIKTQPKQEIKTQQQPIPEVINELPIHSDSDSFTYPIGHGNQLDPKRGKEILDSYEDSKNSESQKNIGSDLKEEEHRQLNRTTSSQQIPSAQNDDEDSEDQLSQQDQFSQKSPIDTNNLNKQSVDEDPTPSKNLQEHIHKTNFFTQILDNDSDIKVQPSLFTKDLDEEIKEEQKHYPSQINVQDQSKDIQEPYEIPSSLITKDIPKSHFRNEQIYNASAKEQEEAYNGQPTSPTSDVNQRYQIQTGSQSLVSTLSDGLQITEVLQEANRDYKIEEQERKLQTDKITEDVFKLLMDELKLELDLLLMTVPKKPEQQQQENVFNESGRFLIFERRGIKTDLFAIERYVEEVLDEVLKERPKFTQNIQTPLSRNAREVLNQLQNSEIGSYDHFDVNYPQVLPLELYLKLEKRRKEHREQSQNGENPGQDRNLLAECEHIHNKVLFDCINDSLLQFKYLFLLNNSFRPYGKDGQPLPWSRLNRRLRPMEEFTVEEMFEIVKHDLFRWAIMQAGTLPRKEFVFGGVFDDELFAEIREKKLATLLAREMIETEPKWLNYEFEEAQVKIDIGDMILEQLVTETIAILKQNQANLP